MRVAIYSPYLDTLGGGEKYMMTIAQILSDDNLVDVLLDSHIHSFGAGRLKKDLGERFDLDLSKTNFIKAPVGKNALFLDRIFFLRKYDLLFYLTDGSIFYPTARRNILHIQTPLIGQPTKSLWGRIKLRGWNLIIYNSRFTKAYSKDHWPLKSRVIYPPVDVDKIRPLVKKQYILSVGRFFGYLKEKKHDLLIKEFRKLYMSGRLSGWSLHLVGSASDGDKPYIEELKKLANDLPVNFYPNLGYDDLIKLYGQSSIYWHASGFGEEDPTKMEHFGISTVESMAAGCIPVVIGKGGQTEIVEHGKSGYLWNSLDELKRFTSRVIENADVLKKMSREAQKRSKSFSNERFMKEIVSIA